MLRIVFISLFAFGISILTSSPAIAGPDDFHNGTVFPEFGKIALIDADMVIPKRARFRVAFDSAKETEAGKINQTLNSAARFINMHVEAGVAEKNVKAAIVFHGKASTDLTKNAFYSKQSGGVENANAEIVKALTNKGVRIILCGQTAAYRDISKGDLLPGVEMALSAMTAHALLQQERYTLNPF